MNDFDVAGWIIAFEDGDLNDYEILVGFSHLVKSGLASNMQGSYQRSAASLMDQGYLTPEGEITDAGWERVG